MTSDEPRIRWAPKVRKDKILRLYKSDALGLQDDELADDVGHALHARCVSILEVTQAVRGLAKCHGCGHVIRHSRPRDDVLHCNRCGWSVPWQTYRNSYKGRQLFGGAAIQAFVDFTERFPMARTYPEKMLLINQLIHEFHWNLVRGQTEPKATRPVAANLIDCGKLSEVTAFLTKLSNG
jgi:ribosomal protein L37AE/L43A